MTTGMPGAGSHMMVSAYSGPPPLQNATYLTQWTLNPVVLAVTVAGAVLYLVGVRRHKAAGGQWQLSQTAFFLSGLALFAVGPPEVAISWLRVSRRAVAIGRGPNNSISCLTGIPPMSILNQVLYLLRTRPRNVQLGDRAPAADPVSNDDQGQEALES